MKRISNRILKQTLKHGLSDREVKDILALDTQKPISDTLDQRFIDDQLNRYLKFGSYSMCLRLEEDLIHVKIGDDETKFSIKGFAHIDIDAKTQIQESEMRHLMLRSMNSMNGSTNNSKIKIIIHLIMGVRDQWNRIQKLKDSSYHISDDQSLILVCAKVLRLLFDQQISCKTTNETHFMTDPDNIDSVIGDHVIKMDMSKLEILEKNLGTTNPQVAIKRKLIDKKIYFNKVYQILISTVTMFEDLIISTIQQLIKQNSTDTKIKSICQLLKPHHGTLKGFEQFCRITGDVVTSYPTISSLNPMKFLSDHIHKIRSLVDSVNRFNLYGESDESSDLSYNEESNFVSTPVRDLSDRKIDDIISKLIDSYVSSSPQIPGSIHRLLRQVRFIIQMRHEISPVICFVSGIDSDSELDLQQISNLVTVNDDDQFIEPFNSSPSDFEDQALLDMCEKEQKFTKESEKEFRSSYRYNLTMKLMESHPFISRHIAEKMVWYITLRFSSLHILSGISDITAEISHLDIISSESVNKFRAMITTIPICDTLTFMHNGVMYEHRWADISVTLNRILTEHMRNFIMNDKYITFQIMLLYDTIQYMEQHLGITHTADGSQIEYHVKGGFCRDIILNYLSLMSVGVSSDDSIDLDEKESDSKIFNKSVKDIDVAMNIDPEIFTYYLCKVAVEKYGYYPTKRWNNAEKSEKGKNISVWSVKLMEGYEPMEFVHFRSDVYNPETSAVVATDVYSSLADDIRRDVPWPSLRLNDLSIVDYFDIIGMLNRGDFVMRTPPRADEMYVRVKRYETPEETKYSPINISEAKINYQTHLESAERIIRLFKFISSPFNSHFAFGYDMNLCKFTKKTTRGFQIHKDLISLYQNPTTSLEHTALAHIYKYIRKWLEGGILANVFKSIAKIPATNPNTFFKLFEDFKMINVIFDDNYHNDLVLKYSRCLEKMMRYSGKKFSLPYMIMGLGVKDKDLMFKHMKMLSMSNDTQSMAEILADHGDLLFGRTIDTYEDFMSIRTDPKIQSLVLNLLQKSSSSYYFVYCVEVINILGFSLDAIDVRRYIDLCIDKKIADKVIGCFSQIIGDYVSLCSCLVLSDVNSDLIHRWFRDRCTDTVITMLARIVGAPYVENLHINTLLDSSVKSKILPAKTLRSLSKTTASIVRSKIECMDKDMLMNMLMGLDTNHDTNLMDMMNGLINDQLQKIFTQEPDHDGLDDHSLYISPMITYVQKALTEIRLLLRAESTDTKIKWCSLNELKIIFNQTSLDINTQIHRSLDLDLSIPGVIKESDRIDPSDTFISFTENFKDAKALEKHLISLLKE